MVNIESHPLDPDQEVQGASLPNDSDGRKFKIPYGERDGEILHVSMVDRGIQCGCVCPVCKDRLIARKGSKTAHHFAHFSRNSCDGETLLHVLGKRLLARRIQEALDSSQELPISWKCDLCRENHEGNLIKNVAFVALEKSLGSIRPDLALFDVQNKVRSIVEVVVSHHPDEAVLEFGVENRVPIAEIHLKVAADLDTIMSAPILSMTKATVCTRPKCPTCAKPLSRKVLHVVDTECWKCRRPMKAAIISIDSFANRIHDFDEHETNIAEDNGVLIKKHYSQTMNESYRANTCRSCGTFIGGFYTHHHSYLMAPENAVDEVGVCQHCDRDSD